MKTWTPLFNSIIDSSIWGESKDVKILWVTMLAKKDLEGRVESTLPGLARAAVLTIEECEQAMVVLESPDPHSSTPDFEGRRVKKVDGGWQVLNHQKYRDEIQRMKAARRREYNRVKQAEYRLKKKLAGEQEYEDALERGATQEELDRIVERHMPKGNGKG